MTDDITAAQVRGARGMLDWSMLDLSRAAELSVSTVKRFEHDGPQPVSSDARQAIQEALEAEGIRFLDDEDGGGAGLRLRTT